MEKILEALNPEQRNAVLHGNGPSMVIAGAGSGKTRVLTYRIAHLLNQGVDAFNILSLTFTNKAAKEMRERITKLVDESSAKSLWMGTFHSIFARILRIEGHLLGFPKNFTIYDTSDARNVITQIIKEKDLDKEVYKPKLVASKISSLKNSLITPKVYFDSPHIMAQDNEARIPLLGEIYASYLERCFRSGAMDFDDLLFKTNELLYRFPEVLSRYQERFKYILVDEYQDTNRSQYLIVKSLAAKYENICVVGDDAQSIYAFRGANIQNILNFQSDYPDSSVYKLEQNYRSTKNIVNAANSIISKNKDQLKKNVWTDNEVGDKIVVHKAVSDRDEANFVLRTIFELRNTLHCNYNEIAILYRTNAQARVFEEALLGKRVPHKIYGGQRFRDKKTVKDITAYYRLAINQNDEEALLRAIKYPKKGIGDTSITRLQAEANNRSLSLWDLITNILNFEIQINKPTKYRIKEFATNILSFQSLAANLNASKAAEQILKATGILEILTKDLTIEGKGRLEDAQELINSISDFTEQEQQIEDGEPSLSKYLQENALISTSEETDSEDDDKVTLMTVHLAKGLEYPYVFIAGLENELFPNMNGIGSSAELEEERRLFYVALTRAEKKAFLTHAQSRYRWGKTQYHEPSAFLSEIDEEYLDVRVPEFSPFGVDSQELKNAFGPPKATYKKRTGNMSTTASSKTTPRKTGVHPHRKNLKPLQPSSGGTDQKVQNLTEGMRVIHDRFGMGVVKTVEGTGIDQKATVTFDNAGDKKLLMKFAKLRILTK